MDRLAVYRMDRFLRESSKQQTREESDKDSSGFSEVMKSECMKYTDDMNKINKIIGG